MSAETCQRAALELRDGAAGGREVHEGIIVEVRGEVGVDQRLEVGVVACLFGEGCVVGGTEAGGGDVADGEVVFIAVGQHGG